MSDKIVVKNQNKGIGVLGLLGVVFVTLKLLGISAVASWSWWWVTLPFWGGIGLVLAIWIIAVLIVGVIALFAKLLDK